MKKFLVLGIMILMFTSCGDDKKAPGNAQATLEPLAAENITPQALWKRISQEESYKKYAFWPGYEGIQEGSVPHGPYHKLLINTILKKALPVKDSLAPEGSIVVKDNYNRDQEQMTVYVMAKIKGFDPANNDWYWARFNPDGSGAMGGKLESCIECHLAVKDNDFVFLRALNGED